MANPNNFPDKNFFRFSEEHLAVSGMAWEFSFDISIPAGAKENIIFSTQSTQALLIRLNMSSVDTGVVQSFVSTMYRAPAYTGGNLETTFPLNDSIQFPQAPELVKIFSGAVVTNVGTQVYPSKTHGTGEESGAVFGHHGFYSYRKNEIYLHEMENTSGQASIVTVEGVLAYSTD